MSEHRQIIKAAGVVGAFTLLSRLTGLIRDIILAAALGDKRLADIFFVALQLPYLVRRVLGEGALSSFIVPLFDERCREGGAAQGWAFLNRTLNLLAIVALAITLAGMFYAEEIFNIFGGAGLRAREADIEEYVRLGVSLTRIMLPFIIGLTVASLMMGVLHALRSFTTPSLGSVMLNLTMIAAGGAALVFDASIARAVTWLAWSVLAGAFLRVALMVPTLRGFGWRWRLDFTIHDPQLRKLVRMMGIGLASLIVVQVNIVVVSNFATLIDDGVRSRLTYADRLLQFPLALTALAMATALLPQLTVYLAEKRYAELGDMMAFTKRLEVILMLPASVGLMVFGLPIVELLLLRGQFDAAAARGTYLALFFMAPVLLPMSFAQLSSRLFYARKDLVSPFKASIVSMLANVGGCLLFTRFEPTRNEGGLALAFTCAGIALYLALAFYTRRTIGPLAHGTRPRIAETLWKAALAALLANGLGWLAYQGLRVGLGVPQTTLARSLYLLPVIVAVSLLYFWLTHALRVPDADRAAQMLLRKLARRKPSAT